VVLTVVVGLALWLGLRARDTNRVRKREARDPQPMRLYRQTDGGLAAGRIKRS
jgi:hypothetical protein